MALGILQAIVLSSSIFIVVSAECTSGRISVRCDTLPSIENPLELQEDQTSLYFTRVQGAVPAGHFKHLGKVIDLEMYPGITEMQPGAFEGLDSIRFINLFNNSIQSIKRGIFSGCSSLTHLVLKRNKINNIEPRAFEDLKDLRFLDLSENPEIGVLKDHIFSGLESLILVQCVKCGIYDIEPLAFDDVSQLKEINLRSNNLKTIQGTEFGKLVELEEIDLSQNNITYINVDELIENHINLRRIVLKRNLLPCSEMKEMELKFITSNVMVQFRTFGSDEDTCKEDVPHGV